MELRFGSASDFGGWSKVVKKFTLQDELWNVGCVVTSGLINMGFAPNGSQRYFCPQCKQTFNERFDTLYYHRHVSSEQIRQVLQAHSARE